MVAANIEAGVVGIVRIAGAGQVDAADRRIAGVEHHHRAAVAGVDGDLAAAVDGQRLVDGHRAGVGAGRRFEQGAGGRLVDQVLEGLEAMHALVAFVQHEGRLRAVDIGAGAHAGRHVGLRLGIAGGQDQQERGGQAQPGQLVQAAHVDYSAVPSRNCLRRMSRASIMQMKIATSRP